MDIDFCIAQPELTRPSTHEPASDGTHMKQPHPSDVATHLSRVALEKEAKPTRARLSGIDLEVGAFYELNIHDLWCKAQLAQVSQEQDVLLFNLGGHQQQPQVILLTSACLQRMWDMNRLRLLKMPRWRVPCHSTPHKTISHSWTRASWPHGVYY